MQARTLCFALMLLLFAAGCSTTQPATQEAAGERAAQPFSAKSVYVYVDDDQKGVTPATIRIRRSFGAYEVTLRSATEVLRTFEIEQVSTADKTALDYSFWGDDSGATRTFDALNLKSKKDDDKYIIPYYSYPIRIEDRDYNLTLLVQD